MRELIISKNNIFLLILRLWNFLNKRRKNELKFVLLLVILSSFIEIVCLSSVIPFLSLLSDTNVIAQNIYQKFPILEIFDIQKLIYVITIIFIASNLLAGFFRIITLKLSTEVAAKIGVDISIQAYRKILYQNYIFHISNSSSVLISNLTNDIHRLIYSILNPLIQLVGSLIIALSIFMTLIFIDPLSILFSTLIIVGAYFLVILKNKKVFRIVSSNIVKSNESSIRSLQEGLGAIRNLILGNYQEVYLNSFKQSNTLLRGYEAKGVFLSAYPKFIIESIGISCIAIIGFTLKTNSGIESALPSLGALSLGALKMLSLIQRIYEGLSYPQTAKSSLLNILNLLEIRIENNLKKNKKDFKFKKSIQLKDVNFTYNKESSLVLKNVNLTINKGQNVGIIGITGGGKSTLLDLIMGLIMPDSGEIIIDDINLINDNYPERILSWQSLLEHVPQNIFLIDRSIAENIAFGYDLENIDFQKLKEACINASILEYIEKLPEGFYTKVGERGIKLSGGQIQRIGIARALYNEKELLILDEATSALDEVTESLIIKNLNNLYKNLTIIKIAHRKKTLNNCDVIYRIEDNQIFKVDI